MVITERRFRIELRLKAINRFWACSILICSVATCTQAQGWRGIKPLHSTREDVERLIGPPMRRNDSVYDLKDGRASISYADVSCTKGWPYGWRVKPGTVTGITIYPQPRPKLSELPIDISKSKKYVDPSGVIHYNDDDEGLSVAVDPDEFEVKVIEYYPATSDDDLRCPEAAARAREIKNGEKILRAPDVSYSDSLPEQKQSRLNAFADGLKDCPPDSIVYIIAYAGRRARIGEAQKRATEAKDYLTTKRGIDPGRMVIVDGGYRDPAGVDLFLVRPNQPKPLSSPNLYPGNVQIIEDSNGARNRPRPLP